MSRPDTRSNKEAGPKEAARPDQDASAVTRSDVKAARVAVRLGAAEAPSRADVTDVVDSADPQTQARKTEREPTIAAASVVDGDSPVSAVSLKAMQASTSSAEVVKTAAAAPQLPSVVEVIGSAFFNLLAAAEKLVVGPPVVPTGSSVTVKSSTLEIRDGHVVPADWYYPERDEPPERLIYLQHGFLATGPMYSYTAAYLAEGTNSVVVATTLTSNPFAADRMWLGGDGMHRAVADLFVGDREALTESALAAGYAEKYYPENPEEAALPQQFALIGHSLGGGLVSGVAGYTAENGAADNLVGVILLDGVPPDGVLPNALGRLADHEAETGRYVPVREIGAPANAWNSTSNVNQELTEARPGRYNGVVVIDGVHMDGMQGGNPIIQLAAYLLAGIPQPQNPPAVRELAITWLNEWFEGDTDAGDDLVPGSTIDLNEDGTAQGIVIGAPATSSSIPGELLAKFVNFEPAAASSIVSPAGYRLVLRPDGHFLHTKHRVTS